MKVTLLAISLCFLLSCVSAPVTPVTLPEMQWPPEYPGWVLVKEDQFIKILEDKAVAEEKLRIIYREHGISVEE